MSGQRAITASAFKVISESGEDAGQSARPTHIPTPMKIRSTLTTLLVLAFNLFAFASAAADTTISQPGEGAGQTSRPNGIAVDRSTGDLYVADTANRRVGVFDSEGHFALA